MSNHVQIITQMSNNTLDKHIEVPSRITHYIVIKITVGGRIFTNIEDVHDIVN